MNDENYANHLLFYLFLYGNNYKNLLLLMIHSNSLRIIYKHKHKYYYYYDIILEWQLQLGKGG